MKSLVFLDQARSNSDVTGTVCLDQVRFNSDVTGMFGPEKVQ